MYLGSWKIDDLLTFTAVTTRVDTGSATDADSAPSYRVYEDETSTPILTGTMALLDSANTAGFYSEQITLSAANGFERGKSYNVYIQATVNSITGAAVRNFQIAAAVDTTYINAGLLNGYNVTLKLKQLDIENSAGVALRAASTGGNGSGIHAVGAGTGDGLRAVGGASGIAATGGSENGLTAIGPNGKAGIYAVGGGLTGAGTGDGILAIGGSEDQSGTGHGIDALGSNTGDGIHAESNDEGSGMYLQGGPNGGPGLSAVALETAWEGMSLSGGPDGPGLAAYGGTGNGNGIRAEGNGTGKSISAPDDIEVTTPIEANIKQINDTTVNGDGSGTPWGP